MIMTHVDLIEKLLKYASLTAACHVYSGILTFRQQVHSRRP